MSRFYWICNIPYADFAFISTRSKEIRSINIKLQTTNLPGMIRKMANKCIFRGFRTFSTFARADQTLGIPQPNGAINKTTGDEAEREFFGIGQRLPPGQAVEPLRASHRAGQDELPII
nr:hypothetical protein Iba_chr09dCG1910 [Ipomoea batatas]